MDNNPTVPSPDLPVILLAFANNWVDSNQRLYSLKHQREILEGLFKPLENKGLCKIVTLTEATPDEVLAHFREYRNRTVLFHFAGHADGHSLLLESASSQKAPIKGLGLAAFLGHQQGLQLVFLNGCSTQGHAQALRDNGVKNVIASTEDIEANIASRFAQEFYTSLRGDLTVANAFHEAYEAVRLLFEKLSKLSKDDNPEEVMKAHGITVSRPEKQDITDDDDSDEKPVPARQWPSRPPWALDSSESGRLWRLTDSLDDPLLALPPLPEDIRLPAEPFRDLDSFEREQAQPFRYLASFEREQAQIFFGRGRDIANLYRQLTDPKSAQILLLFGQSGVGKSSILAAGLLPRLESEFDVCHIQRTPSSKTVATLCRLLNPETTDDKTHALSLRQAWQQREQHLHKPLLLVLDQLDDLLRLPLNDDTRAWYAALTALFGAATPAVQGRLILGFREEYLAGLENQLQDYGLPYSSYYLKTLDQRGVREAVEGVARDPQTLERYRLRIEDPDDQPLAATIWTDLHADPNAPIAITLQILLTKLWKTAYAHNPATPTFTLALYQRFKKDGIFLEDFLDQQLAALGQHYPEADDSGLLIDLLYHHTTPSGASAQHTLPALQAYYAHSQDQLPGLLNAAQDLHLLTVSLVTASGHAPQQTVSRLSHDTLAPLIQRRYEQSDKPGQQARRILEARLQEQTHNPDTLLPEEDLTIVEAGQAGMRAWSDLEQDLVQHSRELQLKRQRQKKRWQWAGIVAIVLITVESLVATGLWQVTDDIAQSEKNARAEAEQAEQEAVVQATLAKIQSEIATSNAQRANSAALNAKAQTIIAQQAQYQAEKNALKAQEEAARAEKERDNMFRQQSMFLANLSRQKTEQGFTTQGILLALEALPAEEIKPYVKKAETALYYALANHREYRIFDFKNPVTSSAFSPDGKKIAIQSGNIVHIVDPSTNETLLEFPNYFDNFIFSPDGKNIITSVSNNTARVWDVYTGKPLTTLQTVRDSFAFSPDSKSIVTIISNTVARMSDAKTGKHIIDLEGNFGSKSRINFSPDGRKIVIDSSNQTAFVWETNSGNITAKLQGHGSEISSVAFSPDGEYIATGSLDNTISIWNSNNGYKKLTFKGNKDRITDIMFSPNNYQVIAGSFPYHETIKVWDYKTEKEMFTLQGHIENMAKKNYFSPDGDRILTIQGGVVYVSNTRTGKTLFTLQGHKDIITGAEFSPNGKYILTGSLDKTARIWDVNNFEEKLIPNKTSGDVKNAIFSPNGNLILTVSDSGNLKSFVDIWDSNTRDLILTLDNSGIIADAAFSPDNQKVVTSSNGFKGNLIHIWDVYSGKILHTLEGGHSSEINSVSFSSDGKYIVSASSDNTTLIWDVKFGDVILTLRDADIVNIASAAFSPKNDKIVTNSWDNSVFIWDANTGKKLAVLKDQHGDIGNRIFDAMGNLVWNIYTGTALLSMPNYPYYIRNSSFSSDGQKIITGSWDNSAHIWNLKTGDIIFTLKGHIDHVTSATFSPNDQYIATTGDNTIRVWDVITGDLLLVIHNDSDKVWRVDFSPDSKRIVFAGGSFARVRNLDILSIPSEDIISYARQILPPQHKKLTPEERRQFFLSAE